MRHLFLFVFLISTYFSNGQTDTKCGTKVKMDVLENVERVLDDTTSHTYTVPVVFHVLYRTSSENVRDSLVLQALEILQNDFAATNLDLADVSEEFRDKIGNPRIQFTLATVLPSGEPTTGIIRQQTKKRRFNHRRRKEFQESKIIAPETYLNVYILNLNRPGSTPTGAALTTNNSNNGVRVDYTKIKEGTRTITHEVGHWLSLYHTFEGGCDDNDRVEDTPAQKKIFICPEEGTVHCVEPIMFSNFMGYSECRNFFSQGQVDRMHLYIQKYKSFKTL